MPGSDKRKIQIQEGLSSYLDAMIAVNEFTLTIQNDCRTILDAQAPALGKASGLKFNREGIYPESEPYKSRSREWNGDEAWIGAVLPVANSDKNSDKYHSMDAGL